MTQQEKKETNLIEVGYENDAKLKRIVMKIL